MENFIICGLTGWGLEILLTSAESLAAGDWKMMGRTSLYMFPIYGLGVLLGPIGRGADLSDGVSHRITFKKIRDLPMGLYRKNASDQRGDPPGLRSVLVRDRSPV